MKTKLYSKNKLLLLGIILTFLGLAIFVIFQNKSDLSLSPAVREDEGGEQLYPLMIEAMREREYPGGEIKIEQDLGNQGGFKSYLISYPSDGLKLYALMNVPIGAEPEGGWPVIILNHGYIPPTQYSTINSYKAFSDYFARNGFLVVKPDYRGHANSEGNPEGGHYSPVYTYDVLNLVSSIKRYPDANSGKIGMWGHSMGGNVTLRSIVILKDIKASVIAAGVVGSANDLFYNWAKKGRFYTTLLVGYGLR